MDCRKTYFLLLAFFALFSLLSCEKHYATNNNDGDSDNNDSGYSGIDENDADYGGGSTDTVFIVFNGTSATSTNATKAAVSSQVVTISSGGTYCVSGTASNGRLVVNSSDAENVRLVLKGASITCTGSSPIYVSKAEKVIIVTIAGTTSYLADGTSYTYDDATEMEPDACIFSKSDLTFYGTGSLYVTGNFNNGITSKDGLIIKSGTINVTSANTGIRGKDYILVHDGSVNVVSKGDGLKSNNDSDAGAGFIRIDGGVFNITSTGDAFSAYSDILINYADMTIKAGGGSGTATSTQGYTGTISAKGLKAKSKITINAGDISINSADDAINTDTSFVMNGGTVTISTMDDAVHAEKSLTVNSGTISVTKAYEGFEGPAITVTGGSVTLAVTDDAINGTEGTATEYDDGSVVTLSGGTIILNPSTGDGLDSNGSATMTGGIVVVQGPSSSPEVAIDINGNFNINGGFLIASGPNSGNMIEGASSTSSQNSLIINGPSGSSTTPGQPGSGTSTGTSFSTSSYVHIQGASNTDMVTYKPARTAYYIVFSSSGLVTGSAYDIYTGGTYTGGSDTGGYYTGGSYSGGTLKKSFTVSSRVTSVSF
jgi:hypothetical protein